MILNTDNKESFSVYCTTKENSQIKWLKQVRRGDTQHLLICIISMELRIYG